MILKSTFGEIDIDMKWHDSFPDEYERIFVFPTRRILFLHGEPGSYFLYEKGFCRFMSESDESFDSID